MNTGFILDILHMFAPLLPSAFKQSLHFKVFVKHTFLKESTLTFLLQLINQKWLTLYLRS